MPNGNVYVSTNPSDLADVVATVELVDGREFVEAARRGESGAAGVGGGPGPGPRPGSRQHRQAGRSERRKTGAHRHQGDRQATRGGAQRIAIQGFGAVAVSSAQGALHDPNGLDVARLLGLRARLGDFAVKEYGGDVLALGTELMVTTVSEKLRHNVALVVRESVRRGTTTHDTARDLAQERVLAAMRLRGQVA